VSELDLINEEFNANNSPAETQEAAAEKKDKKNAKKFKIDFV
jgi:hypothetical protein